MKTKTKAKIPKILRPRVQIFAMIKSVVMVKTISVVNVATAAI